MWYYETNADNSARYILGEDGIRPLVCVGVNPSTAEPDNLDPTLRNVKIFSGLKSYDGWLMLNLYPQRSKDINKLHNHLDKRLHDDNLRYIQKYVSSLRRLDIWCAWGTLIGKRGYLKNCLKDMVEVISPLNPDWLTIGKVSKNGHPHHPLYLAHKTPVKKFNIKAYIENL
jgi:hypothetical protein